MYLFICINIHHHFIAHLVVAELQLVVHYIADRKLEVVAGTFLHQSLSMLEEQT